MCFARAADHLQTPLSAALAPLQLKKPPTPACLSRAKREEEACKQMFFKQTSNPVQANVLQTNQPLRASKCSSNKPATSCKQMFFKQTSHPKRKNRYSSGRATTTSKTKQNKIKQTKSSNCNEILTRESKTVSNKLQLQTKSTTLGKAIQVFSSGHKERQRETRERKREPRGDERDSKRESLER
jgi:hypothetical protein